MTIQTRFWRRAAALGVLAGWAFCALAGSASAQQRVAPGSTARWQAATPAPADAAARNAAGYPLAVRFDQLRQAARDGGTIDVPLTADLTVTASVAWMDDAEAGHVFLAGPIVSGQTGEVTLTAVGESLTGRVVVDGRLFTIAQDAGSAIHRAVEVTQGAFPPEAQPIDPGPRAAGAAADPSLGAPVAADTNQFVDLLVVYSPGARLAVGGTSQMVSLITASKDNANLALANANVVHRFRVVHTEEVVYTETNNMNTSLSQLQTSGDGVMDNVQGLRDTFGADDVSLITTDTDACGLGYLMGPSSVNNGFAPFAYNVVAYNCANGNLSMAHEIGHNMGLQHDRPNAGGSPAFTYAYGYGVVNVARDVMTYPSPCNCPRTAIFSTPNFNFPGTATTAGTATENNALALDNTSTTVANFRQAVSTSCTYALSATSGSFTPAGGSSSVGVTTTAGCAWTAATNSGFVTVTGGTPGSGSGTVTFSVGANTAGANIGTGSRSGTMTIAAQTFTVNQTGCGFSIAPTSASSGTTGGTGSVAVTAPGGCPWTATSSTPAVLSVTGGSSGTGSGTVNYSVATNVGAANTPTAPRSGTLAVASQVFTVNQSGCSFSISPTAATFGAAGGSGGVGVTATAGCTWTVASLPAWASTNSGGSGTGNGNWLYTVAANGGGARNQAVSVAGTGNFALSQFAVGVNPKIMTAGSRSTFTLADNTAINQSVIDAVAGRSYCAEVAPPATETNRSAPAITILRADNATTIVAGGTRVCFVAAFSETAIVRVSQTDVTARAHRLEIRETTLWANWYFTGSDYSSYTLVRNTTGGAVTARIVWRDASGAALGSPLTLSIPAAGVAIVDARAQAGVGAGMSGSVEVGHDGEPQALVVSQTTLSASFGLSFDTLATQRVGW